MEGDGPLDLGVEDWAVCTVFFNGSWFLAWLLACAWVSDGRVKFCCMGRGKANISLVGLGIGLGAGVCARYLSASRAVVCVSIISGLLVIKIVLLLLCLLFSYNVLNDWVDVSVSCASLLSESLLRTCVSISGEDCIGLTLQGNVCGVECIIAVVVTVLTVVTVVVVIVVFCVVGIGNLYKSIVDICGVIWGVELKECVDDSELLV